MTPTSVDVLRNRGGRRSMSNPWFHGAAWPSGLDLALLGAIQARIAAADWPNLAGARACRAPGGPAAGAAATFGWRAADRGPERTDPVRQPQFGARPAVSGPVVDAGDTRPSSRTEARWAKGSLATRGWARFVLRARSRVMPVPARPKLTWSRHRTWMSAGGRLRGGPGPDGVPRRTRRSAGGVIRERPGPALVLHSDVLRSGRGDDRHRPVRACGVRRGSCRRLGPSLGVR
jgi:hypothetical protein